MGKLHKISDYRAAVAALTDQYRALAPGEPVRLAKSTSNLFRFRAPTGSTGLDVSAFDQVLQVDPKARVAEVGGMTTYEKLVAATLPHGLMPLVVPQLKTITLGGAISGLGIESTSFRNGLPHESVLEAEVLTGDGRVAIVSENNEHAELFRGLPNSYGTLGYVLRARIELEQVNPYVRLRHIRFPDIKMATAALDHIYMNRSYEGIPVDFVDGTVFEPKEWDYSRHLDPNSVVITLGDSVREAPYTSDYTGMNIFYRSIRQREVDYLTIYDYLWRWDTDWFWCSRAFGLEWPTLRKMWPKRYLRSDVYRRLVALDRRYKLSQRLLAAAGRPPTEPVIQDVEIPLAQLPEFMAFFRSEIGISPIWLCPLQLRAQRQWPLYPLDIDTRYVNVGFWSTVPKRPQQKSSYHNRRIEQVVTELGGRKSLYSDAYYPPEEFAELYNGAAYRRLKNEYDRDGRLPDLYTKVVHNQ
ncbi:FAD-linked oxidase [Amycolatopsis sp. A1MSW2902]|uniref:FAD-binding oxidoreductase n=1 Tax=Amycolatopsis sp. A1MSW2902 TaxID=687413 RepID=UPI00307D6B05